MAKFHLLLEGGLPVATLVFFVAGRCYRSTRSTEKLTVINTRKCYPGLMKRP